MQEFTLSWKETQNGKGKVMFHHSNIYHYKTWVATVKKVAVSFTQNWYEIHILIYFLIQKLKL
jgi:hypothetical protein